MRSPVPAKERLAALLKQGSSIPELKDFRNQCRDVFRLGGVLGLDYWIEARRDLGLITDPLVERAATDLQLVLGRVIDQAMENSATAAPVSMSWEEKLARLNERETKRRQNIAPVGYRPPPHRKPKPKPRVQRQRPLSPTTPPEPKPTTLLERMATAYDQLKQRDVP